MPDGDGDLHDADSHDALPRPSSTGRATTAVRRALAVGALVALAAAAATGVWLWSEYRPVAPGASDWSLPPELVDNRRVQELHVTTSAIATALGGLWLVLALSRSLALPRPARRRGAVALAVGGAAVLVVATAGAWLTGRMVAWDQVALWSVTVGDDLGGTFLGNDQVRFYLVDGQQLTPAAYRTRAVLHAAVVPAIVLASAVAVAVAGRARRPRSPSPATTPVEGDGPLSPR